MYFLFVQPALRFPLRQQYQFGLFSMIAQLRAKGHVAEYHPLDSVNQYEDYFNPAIDAMCIYTIDCMVDEVKKFVDYHKTKHKIILGGPTPTIAPEYVTTEIYYDAMCIGDGELAICEYADSKGLSTNIQGMWFNCGAIRNQLRPRLTQDQLIELVQPYRSEYMWHVENMYPSKRSTSIYATRGCPFSCTYCSNATYNLQGARVIYRTPEQVIAEIGESVNRTRIRTVVFEDDILTLNNDWFTKVVTLFKEKYHKPYGMFFEFNTRVNCITKEQIKLAKECGCYTIRFGVESGSTFIREVMGRPNITNEDMFNLAKCISDSGINLYCCSIIGVPPETPKLFQETYDLVRRIYDLPVTKTIILNSYYPLHGTPLGDKCYKEGWVKRKIQGIGSHVDYSLITPWMDRDYVLKQQQLFRDQFTGMIPMDGGVHGKTDN